MHIERLLHKYLLCQFTSVKHVPQRGAGKVSTDTVLVRKQIELTCSYFATVLHRASFELLILM